MYRFIIFFFLLALASCNSDYVPRPKGYFNIPFPERAYQKFEQPGYPYTFEYPVYGSVVKDSSFFEDDTEGMYWVNVEFPSFNGRIYVSYKEVNGNFDQLVTDAFNLAYKQHTSKASAIDDSLMQTPSAGSGVFFRLSGNTATGRQFFVSDSTRHFLRGALYFDATPNEDSLGVVLNFLEQDMKHLINTLQWR